MMKLNNLILILVKPSHEEEEEQAKDRISDIHDNEYERIYYESSELEHVVLYELQEGEVIERHLEVEEIEIVNCFSRYVLVSVEDCSEDVAEGNIN